MPGMPQPDSQGEMIRQLLQNQERARAGLFANLPDVYGERMGAEMSPLAAELPELTPEELEAFRAAEVDASRRYILRPRRPDFEGARRTLGPN